MVYGKYTCDGLSCHVGAYLSRAAICRFSGPSYSKTPLLESVLCTLAVVNVSILSLQALILRTATQESEIDVLEEKAKEVKEELDRFDSLLCSKGGGGEEEVPERQIRGVSSVKEPCNAARLIVGPSLVDLGKGPKPLSKK